VRRAAAAVAAIGCALVVAQCGDDNGGPDYESYASYLDARGANGGGGEQRLRALDCGDESVSATLADATGERAGRVQAEDEDPRVALQDDIARVYFACGEDAARDGLESSFDADNASELVAWLDELASRYPR
jgi:hypothetical protein